MILTLIVVVGYLFSILLAARNFYTLREKGNKALNSCSSNEADYGLIAIAAITWPSVVVGWTLSVGVKKFVTGGAVKYLAAKEKALAEWQEMEQLALKSEDPDEKRILIDGWRSLYEKWRSM